MWVDGQKEEVQRHVERMYTILFAGTCGVCVCACATVDIYYDLPCLSLSSIYYHLDVSTFSHLPFPTL